METRIDHIAGGIHRISTWVPAFGITFNQFLIVDERPALIHTGEYAFYDNVRKAVAQVIDPSTLAYVALLHWEGDENGGMDHFMRAAPEAELVGSKRARIRHHRSGARFRGRTNPVARAPHVEVSRDAARASLGLDDGRRRIDQESLPVRPVPSTR
jgi:hypothetical protein